MKKTIGKLVFILFVVSFFNACALMQMPGMPGLPGLPGLPGSGVEGFWKLNSITEIEYGDAPEYDKYPEDLGYAICQPYFLVSEGRFTLYHHYAYNNGINGAKIKKELNYKVEGNKLLFHHDYKPKYDGLEGTVKISGQNIEITFRSPRDPDEIEIWKAIRSNKSVMDDWDAIYPDD